MDPLLFVSSVAVTRLFSFYNSHVAPSSEIFLSRTTHASTSPSWRMIQSVVYQMFGLNPVCDDTDLRGQFVLITGANVGIGFETAKGLVRRGAHVTIVGRSENKLIGAVDLIKEDLQAIDSLFGHIHYAIGDLSDLNSLRTLVHKLASQGTKFDQLILNAAVWPKEYGESKQGYEIAFATNLLGHHSLLHCMVEQRVLKPEARVIVVTGDLYITLAGRGDKENCTAHYMYSTPLGCQEAYSRSKLGVMYLFPLQRRRYPGLHMYLVHPGVVDNALSGPNSLPKHMLLTNEQGAQTTLICATADVNQLHEGGYYHNTLGRLLLHPQDPALNGPKAETLWNLVEGIVQRHSHHVKED